MDQTQGLSDGMVVYLLSKWRGGGDLESLEEGLISSLAWFVHEHARVEVERGRGAHLSRPGHLVRALLAVPNGVLWRVAPCFLAKAIHNGVEVAVWGVHEVIDVFENLDVSIEVHHFAVLQKL